MWWRRLLGKSDSAAVQLLRSVFSSVLAFAVDFGLLVLLTEVLRVHYLLSAACGFVTGTSLGYRISVRWVFNRRRVRRRTVEFTVFLLVGAVGLALNELLLWLFTEPLGVYYLISRLLAGSIIFFVNFFARRTLLFR